MAKILVADDQESMRLIISQLLQEKGHQVVTVADGAEAYRQATTDQFDLIVADVNMPKLDGLEFLQKIKSVKPGTRVIFITGMLEETVRLSSEKFGLDGLILKPFDKPGALELIEKVLARR